MKRCTRCQAVKPWSDFYPLTCWEDGSSRTVRPRCKRCEIQGAMERRRSDPKTYELWKAGLRRHHARVLADPERAAQRRDYQREWYHRTKGKGKGKVHVRPSIAQATQHGGPTIDATAFTEWLRSFNANAEEIARQTGMEPRRVRSLLNGEQTRVELDTVDRALCGYGRPDLLDTLA